MLKLSNGKSKTSLLVTIGLAAFMQAWGADLDSGHRSLLSQKTKCIIDRLEDLPSLEIEDHLSNVGSREIIQRLRPGNNIYYDNPLNFPQREFMLKIGAEIKEATDSIPSYVKFENPRKAVRRFNQLVDEAIQRKKIRPSEALYWSDTYVGSDGKLVFVKLGSHPPEGCHAFEKEKFSVVGKDPEGRTLYRELKPGESSDEKQTGLLSNADYYYAISQGYFPGSFDDSLVAFLNQNVRPIAGEPVFIHDLGHLGGMIESIDGMAAFRRAMSKIWNERKGKISTIVDQRLFQTNELMLTLKSSAPQNLERILKTAGLDLRKFETLQDAQKAMNSLSDKKLKYLLNQIQTFHYNERLPFGGSLRSAGSAISAQSRLDVLAKNLSYWVERTKSRRLFFEREQKRHRDSGRAMTSSSKNLFREYLVNMGSYQRKHLAEYIFATRALSQTNIEGWFQLSMQEKPLRPGSNYYRYMCEGAVLEYFWDYFCR